jgi:hypothetical protein
MCGLGMLFGPRDRETKKTLALFMFMRAAEVMVNVLVSRTPKAQELLQTCYSFPTSGYFLLCWFLHFTSTSTQLPLELQLQLQLQLQGGERLASVLGECRRPPDVGVVSASVLGLDYGTNGKRANLPSEYLYIYIYTCICIYIYI